MGDNVVTLPVVRVERGVRDVVPEQFLRSPSAPDAAMWPYDTPWITAELRKRNLEVQSSGYLDKLQDALADMTGRCRTAEQRAWAALADQPKGEG